MTSSRKVKLRGLELSSVVKTCLHTDAVFQKQTTIELSAASPRAEGGARIFRPPARDLSAARTGRTFTNSVKILAPSRTTTHIPIPSRPRSNQSWGGRRRFCPQKSDKLDRQGLSSDRPGLEAHGFDLPLLVFSITEPDKADAMRQCSGCG